MHVTQPTTTTKAAIEHAASNDSLVELDITSEQVVERRGPGDEEQNTFVPIALNSSVAKKSYGACDSSAKTNRELEKSARLQENSDLNLESNGQNGQQVQEDECQCDASDKSTLLYRMAKTIPGLGIMFALCASCFLGSAGMLVKLTQSVHGIQVAVFRALIQLAIYGFVINLRKLTLIPPAGERFAVFMRALLGACSITFSYYALKLIPLGDATTIRFSLPIWTLIVSYLILGESCGLLKVAAVLVSVSGVVLIAKPDDCVRLMHIMLRSLHLESDEQFKANLLPYSNSSTSGQQQQQINSLSLASEEALPEEQVLIEPTRQLLGVATMEELAYPVVGAPSEHHFSGCLLALMSSICLAMSLIALRLCKKTCAEVTICWLSLLSVAIGTVTLLGLREWSLPDNLHDVALILANGVCGAIGQWFITSALKIEQSGIIALARTFDIEVAFLYSALLLHEEIRATSIVGSILVSTGVIAVVLPKWFAHRKSNLQAASSPDPQTTATRPEVGGSDANSINGGHETPTTTVGSTSHLMVDKCMLCSKRVSIT